MKQLSPLTDPVYHPEKPLSSLDQWLITLIKDKRDLPFLYLTFWISVTLIPLAIIIYLPGVNNAVWWAAAVGYLALNNLVFKGSFGLMLHCTSHRKFFIDKYEIAE